MAKIAVIGICGNSVFLDVDHFHEKGETVVAESVFEEIGGKGINQAVAAARMGAQVSFLAAVGEDEDARKCMHLAKREGIRGSFCVKKGERTTFAYILTDRRGENQVTGAPGAELSREDVESFEQAIAESDLLLLQNEVPAEVNERAASLAKKHGTRVILNPAPIRAISDDLAKNIDLVTPNEQEQKAILPGRFGTVITTLGKRGCRIGEDTLIPATSKKPVDTTGAGDTFNGVLAVCLAEGMALPLACQYAVVASGISVSRKYVMPAIPYRQEVEEEKKSLEQKKESKE